MTIETLGWVYVIGNKNIRGLKVGFSMQHPTIRAKELSNTGAPGVYSVLYALLTANAFQVEQAAHSALCDYHVNKEWFDTDVRYAADVIKSCSKRINKNSSNSVAFEICNWNEIQPQANVQVNPDYDFMSEIRQRKASLARRNAQNPSIVEAKEKRKSAFSLQTNAQKPEADFAQQPQLNQQTTKHTYAIEQLKSRLNKELTFLDSLKLDLQRVNDLNPAFRMMPGLQKERTAILRSISITENIIQNLKSEIEQYRLN